MEEAKCKIELTLSDIRQAASQKENTTLYKIYNLIMGLCLIASIIIFNSHPNTERWSVPLGFFSALALLSPYLGRLRWTQNHYNRLYKHLENAWLIFNSDGVHFINKNCKNEYKWNQVKSISETEGYIFVKLSPRWMMIIKKKHCRPDEILKLYSLYHQMQENLEQGEK